MTRWMLAAVVMVAGEAMARDLTRTIAGKASESSSVMECTNCCPACSDQMVTLFTRGTPIGTRTVEVETGTGATFYDDGDILWGAGGPPPATGETVDMIEQTIINTFYCAVWDTELKDRMSKEYPWKPSTRKGIVRRERKTVAKTQIVYTCPRRHIWYLDAKEVKP